MGLRADRCADPRGGGLRKIVRGGEPAGEKTLGLYCTVIDIFLCFLGVHVLMSTDDVLGSLTSPVLMLN